jgi:hypothetical protein
MSESMNENPLHELLDEMISSLEPLETRIEAVYQFLKAKGMAADEELAPYLEQAGNASNVRWRAFRVRAESLMASAMNPPKQESNEEPKAEKPRPDSQPGQPAQQAAQRDSEASATTQENSEPASSDSQQSKPETNNPPTAKPSPKAKESTPEQDESQQKNAPAPASTNLAAKDAQGLRKGDNEPNVEAPPKKKAAA